MVVDNATVVFENISTRWEQGESAYDATIRGTEEVWGAVVLATLTTVSVFLPVIFIQEEAGQLFSDIALAISAAVAISLILVIVVVPPATARFLGKRKSSQTEDGQPVGWTPRPS